MAKDPAYPMYAQDFDMDTASWSVTAVGIHLRLLNYSWINGPLPTDTESLARIVRFDHGNFKKVWCPLIISKWTKTEHGLINSRMESERQKRKQFVDNQRERANKRWDRKDATAFPTNKSEGIPSRCFSSSPSLSSSYSTTNQKIKEKEVKEKEKASADEPSSLILPKDIKPDIWKGFVEMRKKIKAPLTQKGSELILIELDKIGQDKNDVLNQSIRNSWRGVFGLHTQGGFNGNRNERNNNRTSATKSSQKTTGSEHQGVFLQDNGVWPEDHREVAPD
jgi:uncharacterized protein YdaU (DUF1376 family)